MVVQQCEYTKCLWIVLVKIVQKLKLTVLFQLGKDSSMCLSSPLYFFFVCKKNYCFALASGNRTLAQSQKEMIFLQMDTPRYDVSVFSQIIQFSNFASPAFTSFTKSLLSLPAWNSQEIRYYLSKGFEETWKIVLLRKLTLELTGAPKRTTVWQRGPSPRAATAGEEGPDHRSIE